MRPRSWFFVLAAISTVLAISSLVMMAASEGLIQMVILDMTSVLKRDGSIGQAQFDKLADDIGHHAAPVFAFQRYAPELMILAAVQLVAGLRCPRRMCDAAD